MPVVSRRLDRCARVLFLGLSLLLLGSPAAAQEQEDEQGSPGPFAVDIRGALARYGRDPVLASNVGAAPARLPANGLGIDVGAHWYFFRWRAITFGIGASVLTSRGEQPPSSDGQGGTGAGVRTTFSAVAPQLSFNFGTRRGWSYLSGGMASSRFHVATDPRADEPDRRAKTINYGGGARWFTRPHLAFTFDVRVYAISPQPAAGAGAPATPRMTLLVVSVGVAIK